MTSNVVYYKLSKEKCQQERENKLNILSLFFKSFLLLSWQERRSCGNWTQSSSSFGTEENSICSSFKKKKKIVWNCRLCLQTAAVEDVRICFLVFCCSVVWRFKTFVKLLLSASGHVAGGCVNICKAAWFTTSPGGVEIQSYSWKDLEML